MPLWFSVLISLVFLLLYYLYARADLKEMKYISFELGLDFHNSNNDSEGFRLFSKESNWKISGNYKNSYVKITNELRSYGRTYKPFTIICMLAAKALPFKIEIRRKGFVEGFFKKIIHLQDILIGDEKFDRIFAVTSDNPEEAKKLCLDPNVQKVIYNLVRITGFIILQDGIYYEEEGMITNLDFYKLTLSRMSLAVDTIYREI